MDEIEKYFKDLDDNIVLVTTSKTLNYMNKKANSTYKYLINNQLSIGVRKQITKRYKQTLRLLSKTSKKIKN